MRLTDFKLLSFDCYGTLIDRESGLPAGLVTAIAAEPSATPAG